jgi:hypothetical protein
MKVDVSEPFVVRGKWGIPLERERSVCLRAVPVRGFVVGNVSCGTWMLVLFLFLLLFSFLHFFALLHGVCGCVGVRQVPRSFGCLCLVKASC